MTNNKYQGCINRTLLIKRLAFMALLLFFFFNCIDAQKRNKRTSKREIRKRQEEANKKSNYNKFNELIPMGSSVSIARNDYLWSYETANTVPVRGGDVNLIQPSRFCFRKGNEFGTSIASAAIVPMIYYKKRWHDKNIYIATRHQFYSFLPGLNKMHNKGHYQFIPENSSVPEVIALKNELIVSKPFLKDLKCGSVKQPYIILTAAIGYDYGFSISDTDVSMIDYKFMRSRSGVVLGGSGFFSARLQGDLYLTQDLFLTLAVRGLFPNSKFGKSFEQNSLIKYKISPKFSVSAGYWMNFGKGDGTFIVPVLDISYHFGNREIREKGLFGKGRM